MTLPATLGKFEVRREVGQGAMGIVYEGFDPAIGRRVALKTLKRSQLERAEAAEILTRFEREAQAAGRLSHPNIVSVYEYGNDGGTTFMAMEFIEGRELKDYFEKQERFPLQEVQRIMAELLDALDYSHRNGVVHRDIKPANIILLKDGTVKVADFGIARIESSTLTQAGSVLGTPSYMSPEQFSGQTVDGRSDIFSAGVVLYQFLTGEKPFTGGFTTIMHKVLKEHPLPPSELNVQVPPGFDAVVAKALAKRPDERFQTAGEFKRALLAAVAPVTDRTHAQPVDDDATVIDGRGAKRQGAEREGEAGVASPPRRISPAPKAAADKASTRPSGRRMSPFAGLAVLGGVLLVAAAVAVYMLFGAKMGASLQAPAPPPEATPQTATVTAPPAPGTPIALPPLAAAPTTDAGTLSIIALGLADPADPRVAQDQNALVGQLREDAKRQFVEKALALYIDESSLTQNYRALRDRLMVRGGGFIQAVLEEEAPQLGRDGLMSMSTRATVKVREVQKSLNQMSQEDRIEFIRNNGDPKISVAIRARNAEGAGAPPQRSSVAENLLKERIQSFGFRIWNDDLAAAKDAAQKLQSADFTIDGDVAFKRLSARLPASGITIEKVILTSWTVKCTDKTTGEEIYHNTKIPEKKSWNSEELALEDIGRLIGEEFNKSFFLRHFNFAGERVRIKLSGLPDKDVAAVLQREFAGMRAVLSAKLVADGPNDVVIDADLSGGATSLPDLVQAGILRPINRKLGKPCLNLTGTSGREVNINFDATCRDAATIARLSTLPPAALFDAPGLRREDIIKNPETLRKLSV